MANGTSPSDGTTTQPVLPPIGGVTPDPPPPPRTSVQLPTQLASLTTQPSPLPQTFAPLSQPQTYTGVPLPPLSTPADIPVKPPPPLVRSPDQLYAQATPAGRLLIGPESGWQNMVNDVPTSSGYAQGYYQITTGTWNDFAAKAGVDLKQYPTPVSAPFEVQQQVANVIPLGRWETKQALKDKYPWATDDMTLGQINKFAGTRQQDPPPEERQPDQWGKPHPNWNLSATTGAPQTAAGGAPPDFRLQGPTGIAGILQKFAIPLLAIASGGSAAGLALGITTYTAMSRAATNGQILEYQINSQKWQTALKEHQAQQQMESTDAGDAMAEFGGTGDTPADPAGLQQAMLGIANKYNDPRLRALAEAGDFDAIKRLQARRDMLNQPLMKMKMQYDKMAAEQKLAETRQQIAEAQLEKARTGKAGTPQQQIAQAEEDAARADTNAWVDDQKAQGKTPTEDQIKQNYAANLAQRHEAMQRQPAPKGPKLYEITAPGGKVLGRAELVAKPGGGYTDQATGKDWAPPEGAPPGTQPIEAKAGTAGGGVTARYNMRVLNSGAQVAAHLENAMMLSKGTTVGPFAGLGGHGLDLTRATEAQLGRTFSREEQLAMQSIMAGLKRELSVAEFMGMLPSNAAADLNEALIPKPGMTFNDLLVNYAIIRQSVDIALDAMKVSPGATQDMKDQADEAKAQMAKSVWWTPRDAITAMRSGNPAETYADAARKAGIGNPPEPTQAEPLGAPKPGDVQEGYRFKGGDPGNPDNWEQQ